MTKARDLANGGFGLVLIKPSTVVGGTDNGKGTVSFSGVTSVSLNGVFSATYTNYRLIFDVVGASSSGGLQVRLRTSNADNSNANYQFNVLYGYNTTLGGSTATNQTSWSFGSLYTAKQIRTFELFSPQAATTTTALSVVGMSADTTSLGTEILTHSFNASTQFDSFTLYSTGANMTGTVSVYGYNK
jgi:hypothetical protein